MAETVNIYDAKTQLSSLIARVEGGEEITLARNGRPVARIVPLSAGPAKRTPGAWKSQVSIAGSFDELTEADLHDWYPE